MKPPLAGKSDDRSSVIRIVAIIEAVSVSGPAKNLIAFAREAAKPEPGLPRAEVAVVTFQRGRAAISGAFTDAVRAAGLTLEVIPERRAFDHSILPALRSVIRERQPDIIQTHSVKSHFLVRWTGLARQYPWIAFHHGYTWPDLRMTLYNQIDRWSLPAARQVVTVCKAFALELERFGIPAGRIGILHNMASPFTPATAAEVAEARERFAIPAGTDVILSVGRLSREKGHLDLVDAADILERLGHRFRLIIVGEGPERPALERKIAALGSRDRIILAGHQRDMRPFYSLASVVVLPSHSEGSPNVLLEAMAAGIPVVATAVGGVPEISADGETALLVRSRNPEALARGIERLLGDPELGARLANAARDAVIQRHTPETYRRSLLEVYSRVLKGSAVVGQP